MSNSYFIRVMVLPAFIWLSVFFGGSTGSGIEVVQYFTRHGPTGGLVVIGMVLVLMFVVIFSCFELARLYKAYDYRKIAGLILGRFWWLYELTIILSLIIVIAISSSAAANVIGEHFNISLFWGQVGLLFLVILLTYKGREFIERSMTLTSSVLLVVLTIIIGYVFIHFGEQTSANFAASSITGNEFGSALEYSVVNIAFFPLLLFIAKELKTRSETLVSALSVSIIGLLPLLVLHYILSSHISELLDSSGNIAEGIIVPMYWLLENLNSTWLIEIYVIVLFFLIVQTGVGMMQGLIERIDNYLLTKQNKKMTAKQHGLVSAVVIFLCLIMSAAGVVQLILTAYSILFVCFILVFFIPLLTMGVYQIYQGNKLAKLAKLEQAELEST